MPFILTDTYKLFVDTNQHIFSLLTNQSKMQTKNNDIHHYFSHIWLINKCFGLANRAVKPSPKTFSTIFSRCFYNAAVFANAVAMVWYRIKKTTIQENTRVLPQYTDILMMSAVLCAGIAAMAVNLYHQNALQVILKQIQKVERQFSSYGERVSFKKDKRCTTILLGCTGVYWILHFVYYNFYVEGANNEVANFVFWASSYIPFIVNNVYTIQFVAFSLVLGTLYQTYNKLLLRVLTKTPQLMERLEEIQIFHNKLYKLVTAVNAVHSLPMLIILAANFIFMFACSYFCFFGYMYKNRYVKPRTISDYLIPIIPAIPVFLQFFLIILASEYASKQRMETRKIVHSLSLCTTKNLTTWVRN